MKEKKGIPPEELKRYIRQHLDELGVSRDLVSVDVQKGPRVILKGEVSSVKIQKLIVETVRDVIGIDDVVNELIVVKDLYSDVEHDRGGMYDEDEEVIGTEDMSRSIEDGIPYIPPMKPPSYESPQTVKWQKESEAPRSKPEKEEKSRKKKKKKS